ncbi:uncharacterized protein LOC142872961 [Microcebus murinus]|uniref:uncharacterized protein LOC142872961 n=1 Tax=Microcebus murinus TaxID=30608 RepID=UPI003F6D6D7E
MTRMELGGRAGQCLGGPPSSKKTVSGVPAHLVPSPRRLAKLQAAGQIPEHVSGMQTYANILENQNPAPSQSQEPTQDGEGRTKELSPNSSLRAEPPQQLSPSAPGLPQLAQDLSPNPTEGGVQQSDPSPKIIAAEAAVPAAEAGEVRQSPATAPQAPHLHPGPPQPHSPQPDQDEESGEAKATPTDPPMPEPPQAPGPTSLSPQITHVEETESAKLPPDSSHHDPPKDPSHPDSVKTLAGDYQQPLQEETPKAEVVRVGTPYPELPHPQDLPTNAKQSQHREDPATLLPRGRLAPTRLPQPRLLAPLQSRRPTPKLLSPSREEALASASDQTMTPSPRPALTQEGDTSKLPLISPPHSKPPQNLSPQAAPNLQQVQEEKVSEVKLPLISPPAHEQVPQHLPNLSQEEGAQKVRLPHIPSPSVEPRLPQHPGARQDSRPAKEGKVPKAGRSSSKKIPNMQASTQNQEPTQQMGARKKKLPIQRETAKGPAHLRKAPPGSSPPTSQLESHSQPTPAAGPHQPSPSPPLNPRGNQRGKAHLRETPERPHAVPSPKDPKLQQEKRSKDHPSRKKGHANLPSNDLAQKMPKKGPSLKREVLEELSQENKTTFSGDQPTVEGQSPHKRRLQEKETPSEAPEQDSDLPTRQPVKETQTLQGPSQTRGSSVQRDNALASKQQTKEKRIRKNAEVPQDKSPAAPQIQVSAEEQGSRKGRLRARGSQSTKV